MLGYYAIYASPEGQAMINAAEAGTDQTGALPHQIGARNAAWPRASGILSAFVRSAVRMA